MPWEPDECHANVEVTAKEVLFGFDLISSSGSGRGWMCCIYNYTAHARGLGVETRGNARTAWSISGLALDVDADVSEKD